MLFSHADCNQILEMFSRTKSAKMQVSYQTVRIRISIRTSKRIQRLYNNFCKETLDCQRLSWWNYFKMQISFHLINSN